MTEGFADRAVRILPAEVRDLLAAARAVAGETGVEVWVVGGLVRDVMLGRPTHDVDLVATDGAARFVAALAEQVDAEVEESRFSTWKLKRAVGPDLDVARARRESYPAPGELPEVEKGTLAEDLERRDFTINAMAFALDSVAGAEPTDPFSGREDLEAGVVRTLHERSFVDDPTRLLRAVELATRLGFTLEEGTARQARQALEEGAMATLSAQRLREAWRRLLADQPEAKLAAADELGLPAALEPRLESLEPGGAGGLRPFGDPLALLRLRAAEPEVAGELAERFGLPPEAVAHWESLPQRLATLEAATAAVLDGPAGAVADALESFDEEELSMIESRGSAEAVAVVGRYRREVAPVTLSISGRHLLALGLREGPAIGHALAKTLRARIDGRIEPSEELDYACQAVWSEGATAGGAGEEE